MSNCRHEKKYAMTDSLGGLLKEFSKDREALRKINEALDYYIAQYKDATKESNNLCAVYSFHNALDEQIETKKTKVPGLAKEITCKKGCSQCCYLNVDISRDEAALLKAVIEEDNIVIDMSSLRLQAEDKSKTGKRRCVFLDKSDLCMVYEYRPAACRKLLVITDPELCDIKTINKVGRFVDWHIEVIASAILNGSKSGPLSKMLLKEF